MEKAKRATAPKRTVRNLAALSTNDDGAASSATPEAPRGTEDDSLFVEQNEPSRPQTKAQGEDMDEGIAAALARLRENGG